MTDIVCCCSKRRVVACAECLMAEITPHPVNRDDRAEAQLELEWRLIVEPAPELVRSLLLTP